MEPLIYGSLAIADTLSLVGTPGLFHLSQICADKESECQKDSLSQLAFKIAKWHSLAFAAIVGSLGALSLGISVGVLIALVANETLAMFGAITTVALLQLLTINKAWQQAGFNTLG